MHEKLNEKDLGYLVESRDFEEGLRLMKMVCNKTIMLSMFDRIQLFNIPADLLVPGLFQLLYGEAAFSIRFNDWLEVISQAKPNCWPAATYYLALNEPKKYFFVKPQPTQDFLKAVKSELSWEPHTNYGYYAQLLKLAGLLKEELKPLAPADLGREVDMIDVQSFIWILRVDGTKTISPIQPN